MYLQFLASSVIKVFDLFTSTLHLSKMSFKSFNDGQSKPVCA